MIVARRRTAVTLLDVVVVIAIAALVAGASLVAVQKVREGAGRADCLNRLRQASQAVLGYESATGHLPPGGVRGPFAPLGVPDGAGHGLWSFVLPHLGESPVATKYRFDRPFDHPDNQSAARAQIGVVVCPTGEPGRLEEWGPPLAGGVAGYAPLDVNPFLADVGVIDPVGSFESALPANKLGRLSEITDGASNTLLITEAAGRPGVAWSSPLVPAGLRQVFGGSNGLHRNGSTAGMADGSARFLSDSIDLRVVGRMATRAGGEPDSD